MCGCNMMDDGIDMDVLRSLPGKFIKKIAYHSNVPMDSYNDALKQAIKARAKSSSTNVRQFLTGIPGVEAEIIKIEKMKEGGNLYAPYPKKAQGPFGPKHIDSKTMLSTYAEGQDKKTKEQYRTDMLSPMMQEGGSILNDVGKEHLIIPRNQGTELNIPKYIQAYVQATTNMGKYQEGGALQAIGGIGGITKMATDLSSAFKKPEEPRDPNEPPLKRFDKGGVSDAMNFYVQHYPGYKEGLKGKFKNGTKISSVNLSNKDNKALVINGNPYEESSYGFSTKILNNRDKAKLSTILSDKGLKISDVGSYVDANGNFIIVNKKTKETLLTTPKSDVYDYNDKGALPQNANLTRSAERYNFNLTKGEDQLKKEKEWLTNNPYNQTLQQSIDVRNSSDAELKAKRAVEDQEWAAQTQVIKDRKAKEQYDAMIKRRDSGYTDQTITTNSTPVKKQLKPIRKLTPTDLASDKFETIEKGGQSYKIDPNTKEVFTTDGEKVTDKRFVENILEGYRPKQIVTTELPDPVTKQQIEEEAVTDLISSVVPKEIQLQQQNEQKVRESLKQQTVPVKLEDTRSQGRQVLDKTRVGIKDFFTRTDGEKEEKRKRRLNRK